MTAAGTARSAPTTDAIGDRTADDACADVDATTNTGTGTGSTLRTVRAARTRRRRRAALTLTALFLAVIAVFSISLMVGNTFYPPHDVIAVIRGQEVPGASFTVGTLRLPRAILALLAGMCFGLGGVTFQTMLRNPLASPDIIGISSGASSAAAFGIVILGLSGTAVSLLAILAGLGVAVLIYLLSYRGGVAGTRLILVGIGIAAMLTSATDWILSRAGQWDLQEALRWLTGSLNNSSYTEVGPTLAALLVCTPFLLGQSRNLATTQLGDDAARALGTRVDRTRLIVMVAAVGLISFATAATGPIAVRIIGPGSSPLLPSALVGALLVLVADLVGQYATGTRYPVGVVTGVLGAPFLLYLIVRVNRRGASL